MRLWIERQGMCCLSYLQSLVARFGCEAQHLDEETWVKRSSITRLIFVVLRRLLSLCLRYPLSSNHLKLAPFTFSSVERRQELRAER